MGRGVFICGLLLIVTGLRAQTSSFAELRGELRAAGNAPLHVELYDAHGTVAGDASATQDGRFSFSGIAAGDYDLVVLNGNGREVARQRVSSREFVSGVVVDVPGEPDRSEGGGNTVSVSALQHRPDKEAVNLQKKAIAAHEKHDHGRTVALLQKALLRDPLLASAHYLLGLEYALNGEAEAGAKELGRAVELDGASAAAQGAYAATLLSMRNVKDALEHAGRAVQLDPRSAKYRYILGVVLVHAGREREAVAYLREADGMAGARELATEVEARLAAQ